MKYKAKIERLDWKGEVETLFSDGEDDFTPDTGWMVKAFALGEKVDVGKFQTPEYYGFCDFARKVAPAVSDQSFTGYRPGVKAIYGEFYPGVSAQLVAAPEIPGIKWTHTEKDLAE